MVREQKIFLGVLAGLTLFVGMYAFTFGEFGLLREDASQDGTSANQIPVPDTQQEFELTNEFDEVDFSGLLGSASKETLLDTLQASADEEDQFECTYLDENTEAEIYVSGENVRVDSRALSESGFDGTIIDTEALYLITEGVAYEIPEDSGSFVSPSLVYNMLNNVLEENIETFDETCLAAEVVPSVFELPEDIEILDASDISFDEL